MRMELTKPENIISEKQACRPAHFKNTSVTFQKLYQRGTFKF